jgi:hypothetical protein
VSLFFNLCQRDVIDYHHTVSSSSLRDDDDSDDGESDIARASATLFVVDDVVVVVETRVHGGAFARDDVDVNSRRSCTSRSGKTDDDDDDDDDDEKERVGVARNDGGARNGWLDRSERGASGRR